jgi:hypothetical protein
MALKRTFSAADGGGAGRRRRRARQQQLGSQGSQGGQAAEEDDPFGFSFEGGGGGGSSSPGFGSGSPRGDDDSSCGSQGLSSMSYHKMSTDTRRKGASLHTISSGRIRAQMDELVFHLDGLCSGELGAQRQRFGGTRSISFSPSHQPVWL